MPIPPIYFEDMKYWFVQLEAIFNLSNIDDELTQYYILVASLREITSTILREIILNGPSAPHPYLTLKRFVLDLLEVPFTYK